MAANTLRIARTNPIDTAVLSASSSVVSLPVDRLQNEDVQSLWRATSTTAWILADFGEQIEIGIAALFSSNLVASDVVQVRVSTSDATGAAGDAYDSGSIPSGVDPVFGAFGHFIEPAVTGRYLRIDLTQASNPEAGRWVAGPVWTPSRNMSFGWEPLWRDPSRRTESLGQTTFIDRRRRQRGFAFTLRGLVTSEAADQLHEINRVAGASQDILVCRDADSANFGKVTIWGLLEDVVRYPQLHPDFFEAEFRIHERL